MRWMSVGALLSVAFFGVAAAEPYKAELPGLNCRATLDDWIRLEAAKGEKILERHGGIGAVQEYTVRWEDGATQRVTVAPAVVDGEAAICVVARQNLPPVVGERATDRVIIPSSAPRERR